MKIIVISDSHSVRENVIKISQIAKEAHISKIIHLGDDYDDTEFLIEKGLEIERIPGVFSRYYAEKDIPNRKVIEISGWRILLTHTKERHENDLPDDIQPENLIKNGDVDIVLYGHTHIPAIEKAGNVYLINPGHLKHKDKKGYQPTFVVLDVEKEKIDVVIRELNTKEIILRETIKK